MSEHSHDNKPGELEESRLVVDNDFEVAPVVVKFLGKRKNSGRGRPRPDETMCGECVWEGGRPGEAALRKVCHP